MEKPLVKQGPVPVRNVCLIYVIAAQYDALLCWPSHVIYLSLFIRAHFLCLAGSQLRLCSANHRAGYFSNLACDWMSIVWAYSEQETENGPRPTAVLLKYHDMWYNIMICPVLMNWPWMIFVKMLVTNTNKMGKSVTIKCGSCAYFMGCTAFYTWVKYSWDSNFPHHD